MLEVMSEFLFLYCCREIIFCCCFNRDLNRGCLLYMFSCNFVYVKFFVEKFLRDLQSFHFVFKITFLKMRNICSGSFFHKNLLINRLLTIVFVLINGIVFNRSNGLMIKFLTACLMN